MRFRVGFGVRVQMHATACDKVVCNSEAMLIANDQLITLARVERLHSWIGLIRVK